MHQIANWLKSLGFEQYVDCFAENDIDFSILHDLTDQDLEKIGVRSLGHRRKLLRAIADLERIENRATAEAPVAVRFSSPESYTPKHLAERILTSKSALEGERKQVTVLFADLKGSMELLADRDPEEARKLLDPVLERMMEAVHRYEGTVNQVMGDGIMALFGAPIAHEDHAVRACYAALRMQQTVKKYAEGVRREEGVTVRIRVGLNSGEVVVRAIGSDLHMDYTAVGQTTHLAARMEQFAEPGTALLTSATLGLCEDFVQVKSLGPMRAKGFAEPVEAYELTGANPVRSRFQAHAARGLTKFVGRASELAQLGEALELARGGRGQVVAVVGEPGVGKSRLLWEFAHSHRTADDLVLETASVSYGKATTYLPVIELLRGYFQIESRDDLRKLREKVTGKLFSLDRALEPALPPLLALLDVSIDDNEWKRLDPPQRRRRTLDGVKRLLLRESQVQPVVLIFEDLHWIDDETQAVLEDLLGSLPTARLLLLINYRPEYQHAWGGKTYYRQLRIDSLSTASAEELLKALLGTDPGLEPLKRLLIERTQGNPFFLEESVRTLVEAKVLSGNPGAFRLTRAPEGLQIPTTAQAVLAARIDRLDPDDKRLLQAASVVGKDVPLALLESIVDMPESELRQRLGRLQAVEFLYETRLFPEVEYTFKHALTHEVTYGGLLQERRRELHARIVDAIERLYAGRVVEQVERLAHHAMRGERWRKALTFLRQAGAKAMMRSAYREAVTWLEQGLTTLPHFPDDDAIFEEAIDVRLSLRTCLVASGNVVGGLEHLREAQVLAERLGDQRRLGRVLCLTANCDYLLGHYDDAIGVGERAFRIATEVGDASLEATSTLYLGQTYYLRGNPIRAISLLQKNIEVDRGPREHIGVAGIPVAARSMLCWCFASLGRFAEGIACGTEALGLAERLGRSSSVIVACLGLAIPQVWKGDHAAAIITAERALSLCEMAQTPLLRPMVETQLAYAYALAGRHVEARSNIEAGVRGFEVFKMMGGFAITVAYLAEIHRLAGRLADAMTAAKRAADLARQFGEHRQYAWALRVLGDVVTDTTPLDADAATRHYREALERLTSLQQKPEAPTVNLASASSTGVRAKGGKRKTISPLRRRCTARWKCSSGWSRQ
jgi:class 3 adenylate cyclase/tetratricopeptide (TPR) repeat protein